MRSTSRLLLLACTTNLAAFCGVADRATAQTQPLSTGDQQQSGGLEEIVVTAQRREERLQNVPIAVTAFSAKTAEALGIKDTSDLSQAVTSLQMYAQNVSISPYIRGIGNKNTSPGDESAAALYVDGVYIADMSAGVFALNNIERIEVLKGPQGTLFGRNATAGVVQIITKTPQQTPSIDASVGYGNYDTVEASFYGTMGITDNLAADLAIHEISQADGWGKNLATGQDIYLGHDLSARSKWLLSLGDATDITLALDYDRTVPVVPPAYGDYQGHLFRGGVSFPGFYNIDSNNDPRGDSKQWGVSLQVHHDLDWARIVSISSYRNVSSLYYQDSDGTPALLQQAYLPQGAQTWTQELQLLSAADSTIQWIVGAYYFNDTANYDPLNLQIGTTTDAVIFSEQTSRSYAGFAQATAPILADTNLTIGLRYTIDQRHVTGTESINGGPYVFRANQTAQFEKPTWRFSLDHHFTDDILGYVEYSRGFKSGVFNLVAPTSAAVHPEVVDSYEIGAKSEFFDNRLRLNGALFFNQISNLQLQVPVAGATLLLNAAQAESKGAELELEAAPAANLTVNSGVTYLSTVYTSFPNAAVFTPIATGGNLQTSGNETGKQLLQSPPWVFNLSAQYAIPTEIGKFTLNASGYYNSGFFFDQQNRLKQPEYTTLNASIDWMAPGDMWGVQLWGKNLTDTKYYANLGAQNFGDDATAAPPLTFGFTVRFHWSGAAQTAPAQAAYVPPPVVAPAAATTARSYVVFFDFNKSDLTPQAADIVDQAAHNAAPAHVTRLEVTGHTDTVGSDAYNMRLSRRRAESVAAQLEKDGIPSSEIEIFAKGKHDLLVPTGDGVREPQNRRVQIVYSGGTTS